MLGRGGRRCGRLGGGRLGRMRALHQLLCGDGGDGGDGVCALCVKQQQCQTVAMSKNNNVRACGMCTRPGRMQEVRHMLC